MEKLFTSLNNLPMSVVLTDIIDHINNGGVALIVAETGSGKTLLTPAAIYDATGEQVLVCEPSRFLAMNAAVTISEISETDVGDLAGYSVGLRGREKFKTVNRDTPLIFETYGMSLASQSILRAENIVLDEAHDPQMDITIVSAIIRDRMSKPDNTIQRLVIMSATMNVDEKLAYWKDFNPKVFTVQSGLRYKCTLLYEPATPAEEAVMKLIEMGKRGILVFEPGVAEIEDLSEELSKLAEKWIDSHPYQEIQILHLHGGSEYEDRVAATFPLGGDTIRILIGTNVMESGVNLPWVDAGVTEGLVKEHQIARDSGAMVLKKVPITRSSLQQQTGRTNRFCDSTFIVVGQKSPEEMAASPTPEILRVPLTELHMHCASLGVDPSELVFHPNPDHEAFSEAALTLKHLGFLDEDHQLTPAGEFAQKLPVGLEAAAILWHAKQIGVLPEAIRLAAVYDVEGVRKDTRVSHRLNRTSDYLDGLVAYAIGETIQESDLSRPERVQEMLSENIGKKKFDAAKDVVVALMKTLEITQLPEPEVLIPLENPENITGIFDKLRQCLLAGTIDKVGFSVGGIVGIPGSIMNRYQIGSGSDLDVPYSRVPVSVTLRRIQPRDPSKLPFVIAERVTLFELDDLVAFSDIRPGVFTFDHSGYPGMVTVRVFGVEMGVFQDPTGITRVGEVAQIVEPPSPPPMSAFALAIRTSIADRVKQKEANWNFTPKPTEKAVANRDKLQALKERFKSGNY